MKHKRDDGPEKQEDEAVDVTPVMICVFVVMCCSMLVLLYFFYDQLGGSPASDLRAVCGGVEALVPAFKECLGGVPPLPFLGAPTCQGSEVQSPPSAPHCPRPATPPQSMSSLASSAWPPPPASTAACHRLCRGCHSASAGEPPGWPALALIPGVPLCPLSASPPVPTSEAPQLPQG